MRPASSASLVPAMGLGDGEGEGDDVETDGAEWSGSGEAAVVGTGVPDTWGETEATLMAGTTGEPKTGGNDCYTQIILCCVT